MKKYIIAGFICFTSPFLQAQEGQAVPEQTPAMDYQECVSYALKNNLSLSNGLLQVESQQLRYKGAINNYLPAVGANADYGLSRGRSVDPNTNAIIEKEFFSSSYSINSEFNLFSGFRQHQLVRFERLKLKASDENFKLERNELAFQVLDAYVQHLVNAGMEKIQQEQLGLSAVELKRIEKRIELGLAAASDLYEMEARVAADEYQLILFRNRRKGSENLLKRLLNFPSEQALQIEKVEETTGEIVLQNYRAADIYELAIHHLPQVKAMDFQLKAAKNRVHMSWSEMLPSLWAYAGMGSGFYETSLDDNDMLIPFQEQLRMNRRMNYGITMSIPIFNRFRQHNTIQQARIEKKQIENNLKSELQTLDYDIQQAILDRDGAIAAYESALKRKESMATAFEVNDKKREKGMVSILEFSEAKNNLAQAQAELLKTGLQVFLSEQTIRFYLTGSLFEY